MKNLICLIFIFSSPLYAAKIAVIDSGVDVEHKDLLSNIWMNPNEIANNGRDEDGNGYQDDVYGWNFAESNNLVIDRSYLGTFSSDPYKFFEIQGKMFLNQASKEDKEWLQERLKDPGFLKEMSKFGNFVHGTHVAGITVRNNDSEIISVKLIPTEIKPVGKKIAANIMSLGNEVTPEVAGVRMRILKAGLNVLAKQQMAMLEEIAAYVGGHGADIANGSFGTGYNQAKAITDNLFKLAFFRDPSEEESKEVALHFLNAVLTHGKGMVASAPKTLFVFAAGNDGMNNDLYPTSPTNIQADNVISVAATYKNEFIAPFSNYGVAQVDIAAPGMLINSTIPGNEYLDVSGTSQAAPYVANVAAMIKDINTDLTPLEIKKILMNTVDKKAFLTQKVKSQGIVNLERAKYAASLSVAHTLEYSITHANTDIADVISYPSKGFKNPNAIIPLPLTSLFK